MRYNPPPNWPVPPGWTPEPGWTPDPSWPPAPPGWQFWIDDAAVAAPPGPWQQGAPVPQRPSHTTRNVLIAVGAGLVVIVAVVLALVFVFGGEEKKSPEDQIRAVISDIQTSWNNSDYDGVVSHFCTKSRSNSSESSFKDSRNKSGTIKFTIKSIKVDGDNAKVDVTETYSKQSDPDTETLNFAKEDGKWTLCRSASE